MPVIIYNGYTINNIIDKFSYNEDEKSVTVSCNFLLTAESEAALVTLAQTAEEKLTEINKNFSLTFGGTSEFNLSHSGNSGFLSRPTLTKTQSPLSTGTSRVYSFSVNIQLPFEQSGYNYRRDGSFTVSFAPSRQRTVSFTVLYTASPASTTSTANFISYAKTWASGILTSLGGTYELISESFNTEQENKICNGSLSYKEILTNQTSLVDEPGLVDIVTTYSVEVAQETDQTVTYSQKGVPPLTISLSFSTIVSHDVVASENGINTYYADKIRPMLLSKAATITGLSEYGRGTIFICQREGKQINPHTYTLSGSLSILVLKADTQISEAMETISIQIDENLASTKMWNQVDHSYNLWAMGKIKTCNRSVVISQFGIIPNDPPKISFNQQLPGDSDNSQGFWLLKSKSVNLRSRLVGESTFAGALYNKAIYTKTVNEQYLFVSSKSESPNVLEI